MKKNGLSKIFKVITTATFISLLTAGTAFAADGDIYNNDGTVFVTAADYLNNLDDVRLAVLNRENFSYEFGGRVYSLGTVASRTVNMSGDQFHAALVGVSTDPTVPSKTVEEFTGLTVSSVTAITDTVFAGQDQQLQFSINGNTAATDIATLVAAGYSVNFLSTIAAPEGVVNTAESQFSYQVEVSKDGVVVATSPEKTVKVVNANDVAAITKHTLTQDGKAVGTLVVGSNALITITEYKTLAGQTVEAPAAGVAYKSSDTSVVVVDTHGNLVPLREGTANITISKDGMTDCVVAVNVKADERVASEVTGLSDIGISVSQDVFESKSVVVVAKDQYGDLVTGLDLTVTSSTPAVATVDNETVTTDPEGKGTFTVTAVKAGTTTITVKAGDTTLATSTVTVKAAGVVAAYKLEYASDKDTTLDLSKEDDNALSLDFVSRDASGLLVKNLVSEIGGKYTLSSSKDAVAAAAVVDGKIVITAGTPGTATITIKEGTITRASVAVTVVDSTKPFVEAVGGVSLLVDGELADFDDVAAVADTFNGTAFTLNNDNDTDTNTITLTYDADAAVGNLPELTFNAPAKVTSFALNGTEISSDMLAQIIIKAGGVNFVTNNVDSIDLDAIMGENGADVAAIAKNVSITLKNVSGYTSTYTINLKAAE